MGEPVLRSDSELFDSEPFDNEPFDREPPNGGPAEYTFVKNALRQPGSPRSRGLPDESPARPASRFLGKSLGEALESSSGRTTEEPDLSGKSRPRPRHAVFEGDAAAIELRSRLAQTRHSVPPRPDVAGKPAFGGVLRFTGVILMAAAVAGAAGYLAASIKPARIATRSGEAGVPLTLAARVDGPRRASRPKAGQAAATDVGGAAQLPEPPVATPASPPPPAPPPLDPSETATRLKLGADLMAAGDVTAARMMFVRVVEAGEAAGAFALAETYDPAVLGMMRVRGGIAPDPAQARHWYEKARDMGSSAAPGRIARLAGR